MVKRIASHYSISPLPPPCFLSGRSKYYHQHAVFRFTLYSCLGTRGQVSHPYRTVR